MDPLHAVYLTVGLFVITFFNPGANLFVVVQTSLASGRRAGVLTGLGVALGDAFYSGLGLFGLATLITQCEEIFSLIRIVGGAYLLWFAWCSMRRQSTPQMSTLQQPINAPWYVFFRRGLITDLSNPQTVLFFISIFSVTLNAETPTWARLMAWAVSGEFFLVRRFLCPLCVVLMGVCNALPVGLLVQLLVYSRYA